MGKNGRLRANFLGYRFKRLVVVENIVPNLGNSNRGGLWKCRCDCGNHINLEGHRLKKRESCGCLWLENSRKSSFAKRKYSKVTITHQYQGHKGNAIARNLSFLPRDEWETIVFNPCHYCGDIDVCNIALTNKFTKNRCLPMSSEEIKRYEVKMNGVDRIDSSKGYTLDNCVPCCYMCNRMKWDHHVDDFLDKIKRVYERCNLQTRGIITLDLTNEPAV